MKRLIAFALLLNASLLVLAVHELVAIAGEEPLAMENGDTNGDGMRNIGDAIYLLQWLFVGGEEPVAFAGGQDHSADIAELRAQVAALRSDVEGLDRVLSDEQSEILGHMSIEQMPVDDDGNTAKTIRLSGVNLQVVNGMGSTWGEPGVTPRQMDSHRTNGLGNIIIGYQETRLGGNDRTGSHNLVVGTNNNYSIWGGQVVGHNNTLSGFLSTVSGGEANTASGRWSTVGGGWDNDAWESGTTVSGGRENIASEIYSTVSGGWNNAARGSHSTVSGGGLNSAMGFASTVSGGESNVADGGRSTVSGGRNNSASGESSTVSGGGAVGARGNVASEDYSTVSGGVNNAANGEYSTVIGGNLNTTDEEGGMVGGGHQLQPLGSGIYWPSFSGP